MEMDSTWGQPDHVTIDGSECGAYEGWKRQRSRFAFSPDGQGEACPAESIRLASRDRLPVLGPMTSPQNLPAAR